MKTKILSVLILIVLFSSSFAQISTGISADYVTRYMWRGFDVLTNRSAIQPSVTFSNDKGISLNCWGSFGITERDHTGEFDELDLTLSYGKSLSGIISGEIGVINYFFPGYEGFPEKNSYSPEIYASASLSLLVIDPYISLFYDFNLGDGFYAQAGFTQDITFIPVLLKPVFMLNVAYNNGVWGIEEKGISHIDTGIYLPVKILNVNAGAGIYCTAMISDELKELNNDERLEVWGKISAGFNF